ncbi:unnamed protein product [Effrenium voratum]|nr:unnamed protein product [Effrenium voratum]
MRTTSFNDCEEVCFLHASRLAQAAQRLPHNSPARLLPGDAAQAGTSLPETKDLPDSLPKTAPGMVRDLLKGLEPSWRCEAHLAPEPFAASAQRGAVLVAAEAWAAELGELLQAAPEWTVRQQGEWAVSSSLERFTAFLRWLTGIVVRSTAEMQSAAVSTSAVEEHGQTLRVMARLCSRTSGYMQGALTALDPVRPIAARLGAAAEGLREAAEDLTEKAGRLLHAEALSQGDVRQQKLQQQVPRGNLMRQSMRRSILGILAGHPDWQLPEEVRRQEGLRQHLQDVGKSGSAPTFEAARPRTTVLAFGASRARRAQRAQADFAELDVNNDGVVSVDEWRKARAPDYPNFVTVPNANDKPKALRVARILRGAGRSVDVYSEETKKLHKGFKYADRVNAVRVALVAPGEWDQGLVTIKDLRNFKEDDPKEKKQKDVPLADLPNFESYFGLAPPKAAHASANASAKAADASPAQAKRRRADTRRRL